ncbi:MAG: hypothetical protein VB023_09710 [Oscillibacter sp.]|nr:hypothetical protein [Oscillibacter sp.]
MNAAIAEIAQSDKLTITPATAARAINGDAIAIRIQARQSPDKLGFPVIVVGNRVKIPRIPFLRYLGIM